MGFSSVFFDSNVGRFRLYYESMINPANEKKRGLKLLESEDMIHFTRVLTDDGSDVIFDGDGGLHGVSVMLDPLEHCISATARPFIVMRQKSFANPEAIFEE